MDKLGKDTNLNEPELSARPGHDLMNLVRVLRHLGATDEEIKGAFLESIKRAPLS